MRKRRSNWKKRTPLQKTWEGINYRARKTMTEVDWESYEEFARWAHEAGWSKGLFVCRIDRTAEWGPKNCCIRTLAENNGFGASVHRLPDGRRIRDIIGSKELGRDNEKHMLITHRIFRCGWDIEKALNTEKLCPSECAKLGNKNKKEAV